MSEKDDVADTLPTEASPYAIQEVALVDQTFLQQVKRQRDVHNKQLRAPVFAPDLMTTQVSSETQYVSPPFSPLEGEQHTSSSADHDTCTSSVQACSAMFTPKQAHFVVLPSSPDIRSAQEHDQPLQNWITHHRSSATRFKPDLIECEDGTSLWADASAMPARILVPTSLQRIVFDSLRRIAQPGFKAGLMHIKRSYWWQGISKDVARWKQSCAACQKEKIHVHRKMPLERLPAPTKRFSHIHIDVDGPLNPPCEGKNTLLTIIDRWTGWPEAFHVTMHCAAANANPCAKVLVREWLSRLGVPDIMTSDRGSQFVSDLWLDVCSLMGIARYPTTSYHPQHTGKIERMHRSLENSIRARPLRRVNWLSELP